MTTVHEPIEIARFWKNRRGEGIIVHLSEYKGPILINERTWFTATDGPLKPEKSLACSVRHLPERAAALNRALVEARTLGLIDGETK
jgi:hypothetical protein